MNRFDCENCVYLEEQLLEMRIAIKILRQKRQDLEERVTQMQTELRRLEGHHG